MYSWITSLQGRLTLGFAVVLALSIASVSVYSAYTTRIETERFTAEIELARAARAEQLVRDTFEANQNWEEVQYAIQQVGNLYGWRVVLEDESGMIVADSHQLVRDAQGLFETFAERFAKPARFSRRPVYVNGQLIGNLFVDERPSGGERPLSIREFYASSLGRMLNERTGSQLIQIQPTQAPTQATSDLVAEVLEYVEPPLSNLQASFQRSLLIAGIASGLAGLLVVTIFTRQALAPIRGLTAAAGRLGMGDLSQRVPESGSDDIGELAITFNAMATDLELAREQSRQLTADVAHELRTPLTNIQGYLEAIKDGVVDANDETIETLHSQTVHLSNLVEDLRIVAISDAGALILNKTFDSPVPVIEDAVLNFAQRAIEQGIDLSISKTGSTPVIEFDETRLRQIVTNLVENALIHTPDKGRVSVEIADSTGGLKISISDTGDGIPGKDLPHIFDQFYRTDPSRTRTTGGAGLGLTIVRRLVEAHGGTVTVESSPGEGTTFTVLLPGRRT